MLIIGVMVMIWAERRVSGWMQDRLGPNRVGPQGLLQPIADGLKFMFKEDLIPNHVDKPLYVLAPAMLLVPSTCYGGSRAVWEFYHTLWLRDTAPYRGHQHRYSVYIGDNVSRCLRRCAWGMGIE